MCTRYYIEIDSEELAAIVDAVRLSTLARSLPSLAHKPLLTSGEITPTSIAPAVATSRIGKVTAYPMQWGFNVEVPSRRADGSTMLSMVFNARVETASKKPSFAESWREHRCIVPASWFFEWQHPEKQKAVKYAMQPQGATAVWMCGLYKVVDGLPRFVIITRAAEGEARAIHDRIPLVMPKDLVQDWVNPSVDPRKLLQYALKDMVCWKAEE